MGELEIISSFNPLDALESISKIYSSRQLSKSEIIKIQTQAKAFNKWISEQRYENRETRNDIKKEMETHRVQICRIIDKILEDPELVSVYKDVIDSLLQANDALALRISEMRIKK